MPYSIPSLPGAPKQVFVVSNSALYREGLIALFHLFRDLVVCGIAANREQALHFLEAGRPDLILVDSPELDKVTRQLTQRLREIDLTAPIVVLGGEITPARSAALMEAGASAWMFKGAPLAEIVVTLRELVRSQAANAAPQMAQKRPRTTTQSNHGIVRESGVAALNPDDREWLRRLGQGFSAPELAAQYHDPEAATRNRFNQTQQRLRLTTPRELALIATALHISGSALAAPAC
jgi:DNA-binding NarL/FixJ family response regulator